MRCIVADDQAEMMLFADNGRAVRFTLDQCRALGRTARGVRGMSLQENEHVISALVLSSDDDVILTVSDNGYGKKRSQANEYRQTKRGAKGVTAMKLTDKTGALASAIKVADNSDLLLITSSGTMIRTPADQVSIQSRSTQGVRLIRTAEAESVIAVQSLDESNDDESIDDDA